VIDLADQIEEHSTNAFSTREADLLELLTRYNKNLCTDPRDNVYALLGIARLNDPALRVDYSVSADEVCLRAAIFIIDRSDRLDLLSSCVWKDENEGIGTVEPILHRPLWALEKGDWIDLRAAEDAEDETSVCI
jgi:hypothetical protein